jgi:pimeloyl-ACP methyl ester carboxylesterase
MGMAMLQRRDIVQETLQRLHTVSGLEFHYVEAGQGPPLVFVHGVLGDWRTWAPQWPVFTSSFRCISYSRRYSVPNRNCQPSPDHSACVEAQDLAALLGHWNAAPAILVGSSYGAFTALALAVSRPELVRAMVLVEPPMLRWADRMPQGQAVRRAFDETFRLPARQAFIEGRDEDAVRLLTGGIVGSAQAQRMSPEAMQRRMENTLSMRMLTLSSDEFPMIAPEALAAIDCPTLLLAGEHTPAIHATVFEAICQAMPHARNCTIAAAGHSVTRDNPDAFNRVALQFLRDHQLGG